MNLKCSSTSAPRGIGVRLFISCWLVYAAHFATNTVREIYPALTLGDHLSFDVTEYADFHPDLFTLPGRGTFINNNPGASIVGVVPYVICRPVIDYVVERARRLKTSGGAGSSGDGVTVDNSVYPMAREFHRKARERNLDVKFALAAAVMQAGAMAPLSALSVVVMFYVLYSLMGTAKGALALAILYAFATPVFYRTAQLNQNLLLAHCAFFAFVLLWRPADRSGPIKRPLYFLAGLLTGWTVVLDYSGLVAVFALGIYAILKRASLPQELKKPLDLWGFALGLALCACALMAYQWSCFGHPLYPAQKYMPPANYTEQGYRGMSWPQLDLLIETAFGLRYGLFTSAPLLLLALYVPGWLSKRRRLIGVRELICILLFAGGFFLFCSANQYGRMQFNTGVRHIVPVVPFVFLLAAQNLRRLPKVLAVLFAAAATYWSWCLAMFRDVERGRGIYEAFAQVTLGGFRLPWLETLERMNYFTDVRYVVPVIFLCLALTLWLIWSVRLNGEFTWRRPLSFKFLGN